FLAQELRGARLMVLATYRDVELGRQHPLSQTLGELAREGRSQRILLRGLSERDVARFIELTAGTGPPEALVAAVYQETEGNPFFVNEIVRLLVADGRLERPEEVKSWSVTIPQGVREVVGRRLDHLSEGCNRVLTVASVIGREFGLDALERVSDITGDRLLEVLEEAVAARVVNEVPRAVGRYSFTHALIRETLYEELTTNRRVGLHRQIGEVLEGLYEANPEPHLTELAHHFFQAAQGGDVDKAIDYATRAAERASDLLAYEEAVRHYELALQALELKGPDEGHRCELLLALGDAQRRAGETPAARETLQRAAGIARKLGAPEQLARAALGYPLGFGGVVPVGVVDEALIGLLEEALVGLEEGDSPLRARLLGRLSIELYFSESQERRESLSRQAVEMARRVADPVALLYALSGSYYALWGTTNVEERLAVAAEIVELGEQAGDIEMALTGHGWRLYCLMELGDIPAVDLEIEAYAQLAKERRQPLYLWTSTAYRGMRALLDGRFEEGERLAQEALAMGQGVQDPNVAQAFGVQIATLRREQGRFQEMEPAFKGFVAQFPATPAWRAGLAWLYSEVGREAEARAEFEHLAADDFADLPQDLNWLIAVTLLSEVCAFLGDARRSATLYGLLLPYAALSVMIGGIAVACYGSASRSLGLLAATMSRWEEAVQHFEDALEMNARTGARPWLAWTQHQYADMLLRRDAAGDREKALALLAQALETAEEIGMKTVLERCLVLKLELQGVSSTNTGASIDAVASLVYAEKPDLRSQAAPDGTVTILFSDIEGSTAKTEELGDQRWMEVLREHNAIIREQLAAHDGFEVKSEGDGFMLAFQSARKALKCAIETQKAFAKRAESSEVPILVRMGLHTGEMIKEGDDFFGKHVNLAARIAAQADGGEILVSSLLKELTASGGDIDFGEPRTVELKGLAGAQEMFPISWQSG
ncbi:MAG: tetratricopeptide repeat protein, partial [Chloroflexi bacterium]|nr:tetratricopeptide repeat protein [Chloroflexota bacterium]